MAILRTAILGILVLWATGCASMPTAGKVALTPLTGVRDIVDAPLMSLTNVFEMWADASNPNPTPGANIGWTWRGGFDAGIGLNVSYLLFKGLSGIFGVVDYIPCRSLYPNFAKGVSPWKKPDQTWGSMYFPNSKALWAEPPPEDDPPPPPPQARQD
ncbi:hypothetical protein KQI84_01325 [bacterium]|nr:hypothetical protein [bacterium]